MQVGSLPEDVEVVEVVVQLVEFRAPFVARSPRDDGVVALEEA